MLKNFLWQREDEPQNMLSYVFLLMNLVYGIAFTFFGNSDVVTGSAFSEESLPAWLWGASCLGLVALTLFTIATRQRWLGNIVGFLGFTVWSYGFFLYVAIDRYFPAFAIYTPQMLFWVFWYIGVKRFYRKEDGMRNELG